MTNLYVDPRTNALTIPIPKFQLPNSWTPCTHETRRCSLKMQKGGAPCCQSHLYILISELTSLAIRDNIRLWADYGTLLGAVRTQSIIPRDTDTDIGILYEDVGKLMGCKEELIKKGFTLNGDPTSWLRLRYSNVNNLHCDIFVWHKNIQDGIYYRKKYIGKDRNKGRAFTEDMLFPLCKVPFYPVQNTFPNFVLSPINPTNFCKFRYGVLWQTPGAKYVEDISFNWLSKKYPSINPGNKRAID